jgi:acetyl-CoA synthetase
VCTSPSTAIWRARDQLPSGTVNCGEHLTHALVSHVRHQLGAIATPSEIEYVPRLPKTRSGKIMRRVLKAQELGLDPGDLTTIEE